jgi:hypothetical protein
MRALISLEASPGELRLQLGSMRNDAFCSRRRGSAFESLSAN